jgi:hypothetical protein
MQTKDRELVHALKKMEVMQFEMELHKAGTDARAATELYRQRMADEVTQKRKERTQREKKKR